MIRTVSIGLLLVAACAGASSPAYAAPFAVDGTIASNCKIGASTSYSISIAWVKNSSVRISLDGTAGNLATSGGTSSATNNYSTFCNGARTLTLTVPNSATSSISYTITVKDNTTTTIATVTNGNTGSVAVPVSNNTTWTITASAVQANGGANNGTYTATVTIQ